MISDELGLQLHRKSNRDEYLTSDERKHLKAWYSKQDKAEAAIILVSKPTNNIDDLQSQIDISLNRLSKIMQQTQKITKENNRIRTENGLLRKQLAVRLQPA